MKLKRHFPVALVSVERFLGQGVVTRHKAADPFLELVLHVGRDPPFLHGADLVEPFDELHASQAAPIVGGAVVVELAEVAGVGDQVARAGGLGLELRSVCLRADPLESKLPLQVKLLPTLLVPLLHVSLYAWILTLAITLGLFLLL